MIEGISAVVATLNRKEELKRLFESFRCGMHSQLEVIVVDQNKTLLLEGLIEEYRQYFSIIHKKLTDANQSKARNFGASLATKSIICFPDDDCWFESSSLERVTDYFKKSPDTSLLVIHWKQNPVQHVPSGELSPQDIYSFKSVGYATYVLFFQNNVFMELGGFIETIGIGKYIGGGEDSEITFRTAKKNYKIYYDSQIDVNHNYISIYTRDLPVIRARQRAMGLMYSLYPVPARTVIRGLISPVAKMFTCGSRKEMKKHANVFIGRIQGLIYGFKNKKDLIRKNE